jgi:hypothetical protein
VEDCGPSSSSWLLPGLPSWQTGCFEHVLDALRKLVDKAQMAPEEIILTMTVSNSLHWTFCHFHPEEKGSTSPGGSVIGANIVLHLHE